jgi:hypothetical protein
MGAILKLERLTDALQRTRKRLGSTQVSPCGGWTRVVLAALSLLSAMPAPAVEGDTLRPYVEAVLGYDTNLFRFADDAEARASSLGDPIKSIVFQRYGTGIDLDWKQSRQQVTARLGANHTSFSRYSSLLDYSGYNLRGEWKWQLGNRWSGTLLYGRDYSRQPYSDKSTGTIRDNLRTDDSSAFHAEYWFHSDWRASARIDTLDRAYDANSQRSNNYRRRTVTLGLNTRGNTLEWLGIEYLDTRNDYHDRPLLPNRDNASNEQVVRLVATWAASGKTTVSGHVGYAQRDYPNVKTKGFDGLEWRINARWLPTGKTLLEAAVQRDLGEADDPGVNFRRIDSATVNATWRALPKTRLAGQLRYAHDKYDGSARKDDIRSASLSASYEAWRGGEVSLGWERNRRDSTFASQEYRADTLFLSANLLF